MGSELILNYHDSCVYGSDLAILQSPEAWLNDNCINFYLKRLSQNFDRQEKNMKFMDPSVLSFFMHQWDEEEDGDEDILGLKNIPNEKILVFLPINDNYVSKRWTAPGGGSHWSMLVLVLSTSTAYKSSFYHLDSSSGSNQKAATAVAEKIYRVLGKWKKERPDDSYNDIVLDEKCIVRECEVPQQRNAYDCGIHALAAAEALALAFSVEDINDSTLLRKEHLEEIVKNSQAYPPSFCSKMRKHIAQDIKSLADSEN